ncbi:MAG: tetratricopeptide repeat protein [Acidobacteriota bacterium]
MKINTILAISFAIMGTFGFPSTLGAQTPAIVLSPDIRVFSVLGSLYAAAPQDDLGGLDENARRTMKDFGPLSGDLRSKLQAFYAEHQQGRKMEAVFSSYVSLALLCDGPPHFKLEYPVEKLPPDVQGIYPFLELVRDFYHQAKVEAVWSRRRALLDKAVARYSPLINQLILATDGYLRIPSGSYLDRRLIFIPDFLILPTIIHARTYGDAYYLVFSPSDRVKIDEIRHQYLHFLLDPFALRFTLPKETRLALTKFVESAPKIDDQYRSDLQFLVTESLVRAIELRIGKVPEAKASLELDAHVRSGALLARRFYDALHPFEASEEGLRLYYPKFIKDILFSQVETDFAEAQKSLGEEPREPSELEKLLTEANSSLVANELDKAKAVFESILQNHDSSNPNALYGLGLIASLQEELDVAQGYFSRVLRSPSSDASTRAWSHIYLARILDYQGNRQGAREHYQAVIDSGDNTRNAQSVARLGLEKPFSPAPGAPTP